MTTTKRKFIIDTDAGIDDAQAILMAFSYLEEVDVVAITTTHGNVGCDQVGLNVLRLLKVVGRMDIPVFKGVKKPLLGKNVHASFYHGKDGFGDVPDQEAPGPEHLQVEHAVQALIRLSSEYAGQVELICLGPLTNIALVLRLDPEFGKKIKHCYIMGGNFEGKGNVTACAEFNFYCDPEAANIVLNEIGCDVTMACWELCLKYALDWDRYSVLRNSNSKISKFLSLLESNCVKERKHLPSWPKFLCCDALAMMVALNKKIVTESFRTYAKVEVGGESTRGLTVLNWRQHYDKPDNVTIVTKINEQMFQNFLENVVE